MGSPLTVPLRSVRGNTQAPRKPVNRVTDAKHVVVVGAGFGGLATAGLLAKQGFRVTLLEQNAMPGGRAMLYQELGFSFDMGPSWYLQPEVFERWFAAMGTSPSEHYRLTRLDPSYRIHFGKDDSVSIRSSLEKNRALFERIEPGSAERFTKYLAEAKRKYDVSMQEFLYKEYRSYSDFFTWRMLTEGRSLHVFQSFDTYVKRFFKTDRMRKILEYPVVFLGGDPKRTPALYSLLAHADYNLGVWYPHGGMHAVARAMHGACIQHGVETRFNTAVTKVLVKNKRAIGVETETGEIHADAVIMNADYAWAEMNLLEQKHRTYSESYWKKRTVAPSGFILYLGVKGKLESLAHHTLFFDNDWQEHFDEIFEKPSWPKRPSYYVCAPSKTDSSVAPRGCENLFILVPVAAGLADDDAQREAYTEQIITHFETVTGESIRDRLIVKRAFSQRDFTALYNAYKGTALGIAHTLLQSAVFRPAPRSKKVRGLFYTGQYTTPGIGVPMCIISGTVVSELVSTEFGSQ
jgi:phytoene desaturase